MPPNDIRQIELRRLHELEKQAAQEGPKTDPAILIEIQDLHTRYPGTPRNGQRRGAPDRTAMQTELDFVINTVAAALVRLTKIEQSQEEAAETRQRLLYGVDEIRRWGRVIAGVAVLGFLIAVIVAVRVF